MGFSRSRKIAKARQKFLEAVTAVNEGKADKNAPIPGHTGEEVKNASKRIS